MTSAPKFITQHAPELEELCRKFRVKQFELFGSAADGRFDAGHSDLDFLVEFDNLTPLDAADRYFGLLHALESLFSRRVDLIDLSAVDNPYFLRAIQPSRTVLYAA